MKFDTVQILSHHNDDKPLAHFRNVCVNGSNRDYLLLMDETGENVIYNKLHNPQFLDFAVNVLTFKAYEEIAQSKRGAKRLEERIIYFFKP